MPRTTNKCPNCQKRVDLKTLTTRDALPAGLQTEQDLLRLRPVRHYFHECGHELSHAEATGGLRGSHVAILGARAAGKSTYIPVMLRQLERSLMTELEGFSIFPISTWEPGISTNGSGDSSSSVPTLGGVRRSTADLISQRYPMLREEGAPLPAATGGIRSQPEQMAPLRFRLHFAHRFLGWLGRTNPTELNLYDFAGEDYSDEVWFGQLNRYLPFATGIMVLVDCASLEGVKNLTHGRADTLVSANDVQVLLNNLVTTLERAGIKRPNSKCRIPVTVVLTKSDRLLSIPGLPLCTTAFVEDSRGGLHQKLSMLNRTSRDVEGFLKEIGENWLVELWRSHFRRVGFLAVSALGQEPQGSVGEQRIGNLVPKRVLDPILWIWRQHGLIRIPWSHHVRRVFRASSDHVR